MVKEGTAMKAMKAMKSVMKHKLKDNRLKWNEKQANSQLTKQIKLH